MVRSSRSRQNAAVNAAASRERQVVVGSAAAEVPDRLYFRIGEVSAITGVPPYVLRYWESEFPALQPRKSGGGQRLYRKRDVVMLLEIKKLLYHERYTVAGAKKRLAEREDRARRMEMRATLQRLRAGLEDVLRQLS
ncbi:MAG: MerR family transcriptional regulator [Zetaproteobacteria bacterium]|nr:MAG: MerR family transcriptional regulator [Zetaproteobacteria bacterium]